MCDNHCGKSFASFPHQVAGTIDMVEELEREYASVQDKVRDLKEYL